MKTNKPAAETDAQKGVRIEMSVDEFKGIDLAPPEYFGKPPLESARAGN
jgi:hypothetical protein